MRIAMRNTAAVVAVSTAVSAAGWPSPADAHGIVPAAVGDPVTLAESDGIAGFDQFGTALAISDDVLAVGAPSDQTFDVVSPSGAVYVYEKSADGWTRQAKLLPRAANDPYEFGEKIAISAETIFVGSPYEDRAGRPFAGSVYVYERVDGQWTRTGLLSSPDPAANDQFGNALAVQGDTLFVGDVQLNGDGESVGSVDVFVRNSTGWAFHSVLPAPPRVEYSFGDRLALDGDTLLVSAPLTDTEIHNDGAVYVYTRLDDTWQLSARLREHDLARNAQFGTTVTLDGDTAAVSTSDFFNDHQRARVFVYVRSGRRWVRNEELISQRARDSFGGSLALDGGDLWVGARNYLKGSELDGAAYWYKHGEPAWNLHTKIFNPDPDPLAPYGSQFGIAVAVSEETLAIGARSDEDGKVFLYNR